MTSSCNLLLMIKSERLLFPCSIFIIHFITFFYSIHYDSLIPLIFATRCLRTLTSRCLHTSTSQRVTYYQHKSNISKTKTKSMHYNSRFIFSSCKSLIIYYRIVIFVSYMVMCNYFMGKLHV